MKNRVLIEVCLDSVESAIAAQEGGADRIELCADLERGGTTPSIGTIEEVRAACSLPLHVLIRPRAGDFVYSPSELRIIERDMDATKRSGANGVVIGVLTREGGVDRERLRALIARARPLHVTFNRAFDVARDPLAAQEAIIEAGADTLLTSGQAPSAEEGRELIADLVRRSAGRIAIMAGAGLTPANAARIVEAAGVQALHVGEGVSRLIDGSDSSLFAASRRIVITEAVRAFRGTIPIKPFPLAP
jgi:copper homeostasis protein